AFAHGPLAAADAHRHDRDAGPGGHEGRPLEQRVHLRSRLSGALGEEHDRLAPFDGLLARPQRLPIGCTAMDRETPEGAEEGTGPLVLPEAVLAHEADPPAGQAAG